MDGFSAKQHQFVACLRELGGAAGNKSLRERLRWSERDYFTVQAELVVAEVVQRGKGRGGSVVLLDTSATVGPAGVLDERSLYEPLRDALPQWVRQHYGPQSFVWLKPEIVGSKGGTKVGGRWRRTDLAAASVRRFVYSPTIVVDTFAFEVKSITNLNVAAIYETSENSAGATYGYLLVHQSLREERRSQGALFLRLERAATMLGVGIISFDQPDDVETWECELDAIRRPPDPALNDGFITRTFSEGTRAELARHLAPLHEAHTPPVDQEIVTHP